MSAHVPVRTCAGCRGRSPQGDLLRLQVEGGRVVVVAHSRGGRSAYVHDRRECVDGLARSRGLERSLRTGVDREAREALAATLVAGLAEHGERRRDPEGSADLGTKDGGDRPLQSGH